VERILLTGVAGLIGGHLADALLAGEVARPGAPPRLGATNLSSPVAFRADTVGADNLGQGPK
jgi:nucleoside-diphosphate-sugar epimerase